MSLSNAASRYILYTDVKHIDLFIDSFDGLRRYRACV